LGNGENVGVLNSAGGCNALEQTRADCGAAAPLSAIFSFALKLQAFSFTEMIWSGEVL
jgi:hypothetical protein